MGQTNEPGTPAAHASKVATLDDDLAVLIEGACDAFEALKDTVSGTAKITGVHHRFLPTVQRALAQSFIFQTTRAYRMCKHAAGKLSLPRDDRKAFLRDVQEVVSVRDVNEHGSDQSRNRGSQISRPSTHVHDEDGLTAALDETSLIFLSEDKYLMGPLNLWDIFRPVLRLKQVAGFIALGHRQQKADA